MADLRTSVPPQLAQATSTTSIMLDVIVALIPALGMSVYLFGPRVLALTLISVGACVLSEYLYRRLTHQSNTLRDCSACVTGLLLAMCLPAASPYWVPLLGGVFAIVVVKQFYGGLGKNFMNPALAGRMLLSTFPFLMTTWVDALDYLPVWGEMDAVTSPTPMAALHSGRLPELDMGQMLLGQHGGSIGEVSIFMLLLGGLYLIMRRVISPRIPAAFLGTVAVLTFLFPQDGGQEDEGGGAQTDGLGLPDRRQHQIGAPVPLHPAPAVEQDDDHASQGKEKNDPGLVRPELSRPVDSVMKRHRNSAHDEPDVAGVQDPFEKGQRLVDVAPYPGGKCGHGIGLPSDRPWGPALIILPLSYHKIAGLPPFFHDSDFRSLFRETKTERDGHRAPPRFP